MIELDLATDWASGLVPIGVVLREAISECYELTLDVLSQTSSLPMRDALQRAATVTVSQPGQTRRIPGIVTAMALQGVLPGERYWYRLTLVPRLRLLELTRRSRVLCTEQSATVGELIEQVIASADGVEIPSADVAMNLHTGSYPMLDMAVQYAESDLAFLSRRAEHAGIFYFFQTRDGTDRLVFGDANVCFPFIGGSADASRLSYRPSVGVADTGPAIRAAQMAARLIPRRVQLNTRDWENPDRLLLVQSDPQPGGVGQHEWEEEDGYTDAAWGQTLASVRAEELAVDRSVLTGSSDCLAMQAGHVLTLGDHDVATLNGRYVVTSVQHEAWESAAGVEFLPSQRPRGAGYGNDFTAVPLSVPVRPRRRTPVPRVAGMVRAIVDGADRSRSEVDDLGCYRIILPFDRTRRPPGKSSNRIRLVTPYGGAAEGFHFPLRPGTQVMVAFINGNPDWPVIVGPLYDAAQKSVVTHQNRYANVITTSSGITLRFYDGPPRASS